MIHVPTMAFQSTLPQGERQCASITAFWPFGFQSTLPQGERHLWPLRDPVQHHFNPRSHKGSDRCQLINSFEYDEFQSTLPQGERPGFCQYLRHSGDFNPRSHKGSDDKMLNLTAKIHRISIHAPTRGATGHLRRRTGYPPISIHAPTRGATLFCCKLQSCVLFQSTLPQGERPMAMRRGHSA